MLVESEAIETIEGYEIHKIVNTKNQYVIFHLSTGEWLTASDNKGKAIIFVSIKYAREYIKQQVTQCNKETFVEELSQFEMPIEDMIKILTHLQSLYGKNAVIYCDAGYNNVSVYVKHSN